MTLSTLHLGAFFGIIIYAGIPRILAAKDSAAAWLPLNMKGIIRWYPHKQVKQSIFDAETRPEGPEQTCYVLQLP